MDIYIYIYIEREREREREREIEREREREREIHIYIDKYIQRYIDISICYIYTHAGSDSKNTKKNNIINGRKKRRG